MTSQGPSKFVQIHMRHPVGTAEAYFVCNIGPNFQISLVYAFIGCPQSVHFATAWWRGGRSRQRKLNGRGARGEQNFSLLVRMRAPNFGSSSLSLVCCPYTPAENNNIGAIRNYVDILSKKYVFGMDFFITLLPECTTKWHFGSKL